MSHPSLVKIKTGKRLKRSLKEMRKIARQVAYDTKLAGLHKAGAFDALTECRKVAVAALDSKMEHRPKPQSPESLDPAVVARQINAVGSLGEARRLLDLWMKFAVNALNSDDIERLPRHTRAFLEGK